MTSLDELPTRAFGAAIEERPAGVLVPERGTVLAGRYRVEGVIGFGGMGIVLSAQDEQTSERVAIKLLLPSHAERPETRERFAREAEAGRALTSKHACRVLDSGDTDDGASFIVMEYLVGDTLATTLRDHVPMTVRESVRLVLQACDALANAHACGIVHRDIKPSNLVITRDADGSPCLKVIDFGVSKRPLREGEESPTRTYGYVGSPAFSAPEQLDAARRATPASDQWSLAVVLYRCLTGHLPFDLDEDDVWSVREVVRKRAPIPPRTRVPSLPAELEAAILRALSRRAEDRFASVADFARALAPFGDEGALADLPHVLRAPVATTAARAKDPGTVTDDGSEPELDERTIAEVRPPVALAGPVEAAPLVRPRRRVIALAAIGLAVTIAGSVSVTALVLSRGERGERGAPAGSASSSPVVSAEAPAEPELEVLDAPATSSSRASVDSSPKGRPRRRNESAAPRFLKTRSGQ